MALPVNITNWAGMIAYANAESNQALSIILFASLWVVFFVAMKQYDTTRAFLAASFLCLFLSIIALPVGLSTNAIWGVFFVLTIAALIYIGVKKEG